MPSLHKGIMMDDTNNIGHNRDSFLQDEDFISWRLFQTKESEEYWAKFRKENPHLEESLQEAIGIFDTVKINYYNLPSREKENMYKIILHNIRNYKKRRLITRFVTVAAVSLIAIISTFFVLQMKNATHQNSLIEHDMFVGQTLPEEEIYLITGNKKTKLLQNSHIGLTEDGKATISDSSNTKKELVLARTELNRLVVPYGKRTYITLADGSEVWLNSGTQLDFPSEFNGKTREIHVDGEIYIDVVPNEKMPFIVHAQEMHIRVMGTSFNLSAYRDDVKKTIVLVEGKVTVEHGERKLAELFPNEKIDVSENTVSKELVNTSEYISWKKGVLEFNETPMSEILKKVGRYYNVQFEGATAGKLNDQTLSGKLFLSNNLDSVMTSVSILSSTIYRRENNKIIIGEKKQEPME
jgi:transmembrane sensor